jgi:hypothetical protein
MRHALAMAAIPLPLLMWAAWPASQSQPIAVRAVAIEGVRAQRQDTETFRARWQPVYLPPLIRLPAATPSSGSTVAADETLAGGRNTRQPSPRIVKRAALRQDICSRHGQRKVEYLVRGYKHWRCRR